MTTTELYQIACTWEVLARKVGNVHPKASFANASMHDFLLSAIASADVLCNPLSPSVADNVYGAVVATQAVVKHNTNLGILLLSGPLASILKRLPLQEELPKILNSWTVKDTDTIYRAIRLAKPGGLGSSDQQDVAEAPTVTLREAMQLAAERDMIAKQYVTDYADVFSFGLPMLLEGFNKFGFVEAAIIHSQIRWLAEYPDSLIRRKCGDTVASEVQGQANAVHELGGLATPEGRRAGVEFDKSLRADGHRRNPGTTADLIAACLFIALRDDKLKPSDPFEWNVPDWL
jgi:triphosphoribosyl-dephospho-CoA synthase